ncbi:MAG TPA: 16S rRNA (cytidine(1402)-2'-O)-methyltransferase [Candidatus Tumulicola sp.]|nr:16S rRNA (cytidine(1402)-2'-O)-methyltransferase [Candidatus Tumulicola sp.]
MPRKPSKTSSRASLGGRGEDTMRRGFGAPGAQAFSDDVAEAPRMALRHTEERSGRLVLCPTPLGNLEDITARALRALRECDVIVAEDTRVTRTLLTHFGISKPIHSLHEGVEQQRIRAVLKTLAAGKTVALATDAGTPGISDPGVELVRAARSAGAAIEVLPGPTAFVGALVLSGFDVSRFRFDGFPPRKSGERRKYLRLLSDERFAVAWYEAPSRVTDLLADVAGVLPERRVFVLREYTKKFEQHLLGTAAEVLRELSAPPRGEFALVLEGAPAEQRSSVAIADSVVVALEQLLADGVSAKTAVAALHAASGAPRNQLYALAQRIRAARD